jgi:IS5 family transposase
MNGYSYEELAFHLSDSATYRSFCRIGTFEKAPSASALQENIKRLSVETLEAVHRVVLRLAHALGIEDGRVMRGDCTVVESNIHHPLDSDQLFDTVRVLARLLKQAKEEFGVPFTNHMRRAKRRALSVKNARKSVERTKAYRDLLLVTENMLGDAEKGSSLLDKRRSGRARHLAAELRRVSGLGRRVVEQTRRRVLEGESVPSSDKIASIFEPHTDIIVKGRRDTEYGHKICVTTGTSAMVLDCMVLEGNPADSTLTTRVVRRHRELYGEVPEEVAFDGAFASRANLSELKEMGVEEVGFSKGRGLAVEEMVSSRWVYHLLRCFRAGIESVISFLKRCAGLSRCLWRGFASFKAYVWSSIISANLLTLARHRLARPG